MASVPARREKHLRALAGVRSVRRLRDAGIGSVRDFTRADTRGLARILGGRVRACGVRQRAGWIHLYSGLDPALCVRLVEAGARHACDILDMDLQGLGLSRAQRDAVERARLAVAYENVRHFADDRKASRDRKSVLRALDRLSADERRAAEKTVEILLGHRSFRWLRDALEAPAEEGTNAADLEARLAAVPAQVVRDLVAELRRRYREG